MLAASSLLLATAVALGATAALGAPTLSVVGPRYDAPPAHIAAAADRCPACEAAMGKLVTYFDSPAGLNATTEALQAECGKWFNQSTLLRDVCDLAALEVLKRVQALVKNVAHEKWDVPKVFCGELRLCTIDCCDSATLPEQIHLAFNGSASGFSALRVGWVTLNTTEAPAVEWWYADDDTVVTRGDAAVSTYHAGNWAGSIYNAVIAPLRANATFVYRVGDVAGAGWSPNVTSRTPPANAGTAGGRPLRIGQIADMGERRNSDNTVDRLTALAVSGGIDFVLHVGDIAYANGDEHRWDQYMRKVQGFASIVPVAVAPGNHECSYNFAAYRARFTNPAPTDYGTNWQPGPWYWNEGHYDVRVGPAWFTMLDAEAPFGGMKMSSHQTAWAAASLSAGAASRRAGRTTWLIAAHHRPLYCTNAGRDCGPNFAGKMRAYLESMLRSSKVDLDLTGHMHSYERTLPLADGHVAGNYSNASTVFDAPTAPIYIVNGAAGNQEGEVVPRGDKPWSAAHTPTVGYAVIEMSETAKEATLLWAFRDSRTNAVFDTMTIRKPVP